jgi:hypothetical protein
MASTDTIPTRGEVQKNDAEWFNVLNRALSGDLVPRNGSGIAADLAGSLGSDTIRWLKAFIASGHWTPGDIKVIHPYNGDVAPGEGWMLCDGRTIGSTAYDTEHGSGHWSTYVGTSPLNGLKLPSMTSKYAVGKATTPQTGSGTITSVGNAGNVISVAHAHNVITPNVAGTSDLTSSSTTNDAVSLNNNGSTKTGSARALSIVANGLRLSDSSGSAPAATYAALFDGVTTHFPPTGNTDIRPDSIQVCFYMRVV